MFSIITTSSISSCSIRGHEHHKIADGREEETPSEIKTFLFSAGRYVLRLAISTESCRSYNIVNLISIFHESLKQFTIVFRKISFYHPLFRCVLLVHHHIRIMTKSVKFAEGLVTSSEIFHSVVANTDSVALGLSWAEIAFGTGLESDTLRTWDLASLNCLGRNKIWVPLLDCYTRVCPTWLINLLLVNLAR